MTFDSELTSIGLSFIAAAFIIFLVCTLCYSSSGRAPPGPAALPVIGNIWSLPLKEPWLAFTTWGATFGNVIHLHGVGQSIIILNSKQAINDLLEKRGNTYSDRPKYAVVGEMMGLDRGMPLLQYDDKWRLQRKLARTALSGDAVKKYHGVQSHVATLMCDSFLTDPAHFRDHTRLAAGRIIMSVAYGLPVSDAQHEYITHAEATLEMISQATMPGAFIADIFPIFRHVPSWVPFISCKKEAQEGRAMIEHLVETPFEHVVKDMTAGRAPPSFTHDLLVDSSDADNETEYKHAVLWSAGSLYGAGGETTYTTILVFLICMARHPEIQKKAQEELDKVVGQERIPAATDRGKLPYVEAVIKEVMRWKPALPLGIPRRVDKDDEYCGYHIPSNSIVIPNVWAVAMDVPSKYPASDFVPERFLEDDPPIDPASYSFGFGRRVCPGKLLAENSVFLLITSILYCCNVSLPVTVDERGQKRQTELTVKFTTGLVSYPMPFECSIEPRSAERSYVVKRAAVDVV